jgi:hypothetical protein
MSVARPPGPPRFLADTMMGGLARWLRILGFDAVHDAALNDDALVRRALAEGRSILTRDRRLGQEWRIDAVVCFTSDAPLKQLAELARAVDLDRDARPFTRCSVCNAELVEARAEDVRERVPENVLRTSTSFVQCPSCLRVYWEGSHTARMRRMLARVLPSAAARQ